jgi:hypothetical protein
MLTSYADETGHSKDPDRTHLGLAGLISDSDHWDQFDIDWRKACAEESVRLPFHMTDFAAFQGQYSAQEWKQEDKRRRLLTKLLDAIELAQATPVGAIINVPEFNALTENQRIQLGHDKQEPYYVVFQAVTQILAFEAALKKYPPDKLSMIYAKLRKFTGVAEELWHSMQGQTVHGVTMSSYARGDPADHTPLQAADLWAYELGHHFHYILPNSKPWRHPFKRLVEMASKTTLSGTFLTYLGRMELQGILGESPERPV